MPTYIKLREQPDGTWWLAGIQQDTDRVPRPPRGMIHHEIDPADIPAFRQGWPLVPEKFYRAKLRLGALDAEQVRLGLKALSSPADFEAFDDDPQRPPAR